jgi:hypothetical protein
LASGLFSFDIFLTINIHYNNVCVYIFIYADFGVI